jgi:hypothetical protein
MKIPLEYGMDDYVAMNQRIEQWGTDSVDSIKVYMPQVATSSRALS